MIPFIASWFLGRSTKVQAVLAAAIGAVAAAALSFSIFMMWNVIWDNPRVRAETETIIEARTAKNTLKQLRERGMINDQVKNLSDCDLTRELGGKCEFDGLPVQ